MDCCCDCCLRRDGLDGRNHAGGRNSLCHIEDSCRVSGEGLPGEEAAVVVAAEAAVESLVSFEEGVYATQ